MALTPSDVHPVGSTGLPERCPQALERSENSDLILVRYANVRLGQLDTSDKPRLLPAFSDKGWECKPVAPIGN